MPGCQATDVDFGPDSRLYVSFWDEGWERTAQGRIMKVEHEETRKAQAAQIADVQKLLAGGMKERKSEELLKLLGHKDQRIRLEAQWELGSRLTNRKPSAADKLTALAVAMEIQTSSNKLVRLHAIWAMGQSVRAMMRSKLQDDPDFVLSAPKDVQVLALFNDPDADVRTAWLKANAGHGAGLSKELSQIYADKLNDESARVRMVAAQALGRHGDASAVKPLLELDRREPDKFQEMRHVIAYALFQLAARHRDAWKEVRAAAEEKGSPQRLSVLIACARLAVKAREMSAHGEPWFQDATQVLVHCVFSSASSEAARLISDAGLEEYLAPMGTYRITDPKGKVKVDEGFNPLGIKGALANDTQTKLRALNAFFRSGGEANAHRLLVDTITEENLKKHPALCVEALAMLAEWPTPPARDRVNGLYRPMNKNRSRAQALKALGDLSPELLKKEPAVTLQALETIRKLSADNWSEFVVERSLDAAASSILRVKALRVLADLKSPLLAGTLKKAIEDPGSAVRITAAGLLGKTDPGLAAKGLAAALADGSPEDHRAAFTELAALHSPEADKLLADHLTLLTAGKVPAIARLELVEAAKKREAPAVKEALAAYEASLPKDDLLAKYAVSLEGGDPVNGKRLFKEHPVAACQRCHMVDKAGGEAGPLLDGIASRKDRRYLLESIVNPNAVIADTFRMLVCTMKDGSIQAGVIKAETADTLTLQQPGDQPVMVPVTDIAKREPVPSGMIPGMGELLTPRELRDIVEYCASLK